MTSTFRDIAKRIPGVPFVFYALGQKYSAYKLRLRSPEDVFTDIYRRNAWRGEVSVSGRGSDSQRTRIIASRLPILLADLHISTLLDIPCGDFHWMKSVDLTGVNYIGADIVRDLIRSNREKYERPNIAFQNLDLLRDKLPKVELVLCRDCLVHFSFRDIFLALRNICASQSEYLLTTTFPDQKGNRDIVTGQWRVLNLQAAPFLLPQPLRIINEKSSGDRSEYAEKSLALWTMQDIGRSLAQPALARFSVARPSRRLALLLGSRSKAQVSKSLRQTPPLPVPAHGIKRDVLAQPPTILQTPTSPVREATPIPAEGLQDETPLGGGVL